MIRTGRYEFVEGKSSKFWEIKFCPETNEYLCRWGKIGFGGLKVTFPPTDDGAPNHSKAKKKINEKINKGYKWRGHTFEGERFEPVSPSFPPDEPMADENSVQDFWNDLNNLSLKRDGGL